MARIVITNVPARLLKDYKSKCALEGKHMYEKAEELLRCYTYGGKNCVSIEKGSMKLNVS